MNQKGPIWYRVELCVCVDPARLKDESDVAEAVGDLLGSQEAEALGVIDRTEPAPELDDGGGRR